MNNVKEPNAKGNLHRLPEPVAYQCPSCNLLVWRENQVEAEVLCPFCSNGLPAYLTPIAPPRMIMRGEKPQNSQTILNGGTGAGGPKAPGAGDWASPFIREFFMVQGRGFRCMAYRNHDGKWRGAFDHEELPGAIRVLG